MSSGWCSPSRGLFNILFFLYPGTARRSGERRRPIRCSDDAACIPRRSRRAFGSVGARDVGFDQCRSAGGARAAASAARSGSRRGSRPPGAAGAAANGPRRPAISTPRFCSSEPAPPDHAPRIVVRRGAGACMTRSCDCAPALRGKLALKWPNDVLCRRRQDRRHPGRRRERSREGCAVVVGIGVNCRASSAAGDPIPPPISPPPAPTSSAEGLFTALSGMMLAAARAMATRRRLRHDPRRLARAGGRHRRAIACGFRAARFSGASRRRRARAPARCAWPTAACETITAGDVFLRPSRTGQAPPMARA